MAGGAWRWIGAGALRHRYLEEQEALQVCRRDGAGLPVDGAGGMAITEPGGHFVWLSRGAARGLGVGQQAFLGVSTYDLVHPEDFASLATAHRALLAGRPGNARDLRLWSAPLWYRRIDFWAVPALGPEGPVALAWIHPTGWYGEPWGNVTVDPPPVPAHAEGVPSGGRAGAA